MGKEDNYFIMCRYYNNGGNVRKYSSNSNISIYGGCDGGHKGKVISNSTGEVIWYHCGEKDGIGLIRFTIKSR